MPSVLKLYNLTLNAVRYSAPLSSVSVHDSCQGDVPADAGFLCVTATGIWDTIKGTTVKDVPLELIMEVMRRANVISVINSLWHLTASSVCTATGKLLDWRLGVAYCSRIHPVRTCSGAQPTSYSVGTVGSLSGVKWPGGKFCLSIHLVPRVRMSGAIPLLPHVLLRPA